MVPRNICVVRAVKSHCAWWKGQLSSRVSSMGKGYSFAWLGHTLGEQSQFPSVLPEDDDVVRDRGNLSVKERGTPGPFPRDDRDRIPGAEHALADLEPAAQLVGVQVKPYRPVVAQQGSYAAHDFAHHFCPGAGGPVVLVVAPCCSCSACIERGVQVAELYGALMAVGDEFGQNPPSIPYMD